MQKVASDAMIGAAAAADDRGSGSEAGSRQEGGEREKLAVESRKSEKEVRDLASVSDCLACANSKEQRRSECARRQEVVGPLLFP